jgi:uncharacterized membrane protein YccF (DUF307 family)
LDGAITKTKLISTTTAADNGKVLGIKSDGTGLEWKVATGGVLYMEDFIQANSIAATHQLTKQAFGAISANNFKVSLNGSAISSSKIVYDADQNTIKIIGIPVYHYDIITVAYITNN